MIPEAEPGELWERSADLARGTTRTYLVVSSPSRNAQGFLQLQAWCLERRRLERFNAGCLLDAERWRKLA